MGLRFQKRIRLFKGLTIHLSKSGASVSIGIPGAHVNLSERGTKTTVGLPGTGLSYSHMESSHHKTPEAPENLPPPEPGDHFIDSIPRKEASWASLLFVAVVLVGIGYVIGQMSR